MNVWAPSAMDERKKQPLASPQSPHRDPDPLPIPRSPYPYYTDVFPLILIQEPHLVVLLSTVAFFAGGVRQLFIGCPVDR